MRTALAAVGVGVLAGWAVGAALAVYALTRADGVEAAW